MQEQRLRQRGADPRRVPLREQQLALAAEDARADDSDRRIAIEHGGERAQVPGREDRVGVQEEDVVGLAGGGAEVAAEREAAVAAGLDHPHGQVGDRLVRAVRRGVVDDRDRDAGLVDQRLDAGSQRVARSRRRR